MPGVAVDDERQRRARRRAPRRRRCALPVDRHAEPRSPPGRLDRRRCALRPPTSTSNVMRAAPRAARGAQPPALRRWRRRARAAAAPTRSKNASSAGGDRHQLFVRAVELGEALAAPLLEQRDPGTSYRTALRGTPAARISHWKNGIVVRMPSTWYSRSARAIRAIAVGAILAPGDQLRDQRVVVDRHRVARAHAAVVAHAGPGRRAQAAHQAGRRHEALVRILGVDAALDGVAARRRARAPDRGRAARRGRCGSATARGRCRSPSR